jgi:hypothetical protein
MRAFIGSVDRFGLRRLIPEDAIPRDSLQQYVQGWYGRSTTAVWALLDDEDAEAIRADLSTGLHRDACAMLLNWAVELLPLASAAPDLAPPIAS